MDITHKVTPEDIKKSKYHQAQKTTTAYDTAISNYTRHKRSVMKC